MNTPPTKNHKIVLIIKTEDTNSDNNFLSSFKTETSFGPDVLYPKLMNRDK